MTPGGRRAALMLPSGVDDRVIPLLAEASGAPRSPGIVRVGKLGNGACEAGRDCACDEASVSAGDSAGDSGGESGDGGSLEGDRLIAILALPRPGGRA